VGRSRKADGWTYVVRSPDAKRAKRNAHLHARRASPSRPGGGLRVRHRGAARCRLRGRVSRSDARSAYDRHAHALFGVAAASAARRPVDQQPGLPQIIQEEADWQAAARAPKRVHNLLECAFCTRGELDEFSGVDRARIRRVSQQAWRARRVAHVPSCTARPSLGNSWFVDGVHRVAARRGARVVAVLRARPVGDQVLHWVYSRQQAC